jgi:hypothetical protein
MQHHYFAAANSSEGFKSYFEEIFGAADMLYVIKGGPGTGKSSFMKKIAAVAERRGRTVEYYFCSSDPSSIDGVLISGGDETVGIIDGTAPHTFEPTYPGAREEILNFGEFWNRELLRGQKNEIFALSNKKSAAYKRAYSYLRSCGNLRAVTDSLLRRATDFEKLQAAALRLADSLGMDRGKMETKPAILSAVGMTGEKKLDSFEKNAIKTYKVGNFYGVGGWFLDTLSGVLMGYDGKARFSYDPVSSHKTDGIFLENEKIAFILSANEQGKESSAADESERFINPKRFVHTDKLREVRGELRYAARLYRDCLDGAIHALGEAKVYHFLLEDIYKNAMDFKALGQLCGEISEKI